MSDIHLTPIFIKTMMATLTYTFILVIVLLVKKLYFKKRRVG